MIKIRSILKAGYKMEETKAEKHRILENGKEWDTPKINDLQNGRLQKQRHPSHLIS